MLHFIIQTCCRCSLQTQTGTRIHDLNRPILKRTDEAVWSWGKCNWDWTATELKAPFFLKIPLLLGRHICASTWFRILMCQACCKATKPSLGPLGVTSLPGEERGLLSRTAAGNRAYPECSWRPSLPWTIKRYSGSTFLPVIYYSNLVQQALRGVVQG